MTSPDRRRCRRLALSLPIMRLQMPDGAAWHRPACTANVSTDGMYFLLARGQALHADVGSRLSFELSVPPGAGYSPWGGTIRSEGCVVRAADDGAGVGVALRFSRPLEMEFRGLGEA